ncbi:ComEC/Rec2 family competence protein [Oribacterium sp. HCP3S3_B9]|uniref:ComEC/Rec2 family competence protein n=1 Tax=Oribacterium sp. HCP3S3_B9 TaxID=3438946 RepID=UPI003F8CBFC6
MNITTAQMVSAPGNASAQTLPASSGVNIQQSAPMPGTTIQTTTLTSASGAGELWMLASTTGAQNLSIVIKSPHGKMIVIDGGWEADAEKLSSLIQQQGGKVDAWLITHPHEDHVGALCAILNDTGRKIKIDKIYCSLATPDWYRQVSPTGAGIADQLLNAFTKLPVGTVTNSIGRGTEINIDDVNIRVLNNRGVYTYNGVNNSSLVYKIRVSRQSILILGDLAYDGGKDLIKTCTAAELKSDIVQMAHHGQQGVDQDAYALIAPTTCLWPTPAWLWNNDNGGGVGSGPWGTLTTRAWMDALGVKDNRSLKDGDVHMYLGMPSPNM